MAKYRKKPVVIDAIQYVYPDMDAVAEFVGERCPIRVGEKTDAGRELIITTLEDGANGEAKHVASPGDWIVRGVQGEVYPVKPHIFAATYEPA